MTNKKTYSSKTKGKVAIATIKGSSPFLAAIRNIKYRYGVTGDLRNIFRREKIVSAEENRIC